MQLSSSSSSCSSSYFPFWGDAITQIRLGLELRQRRETSYQLSVAERALNARRLEAVKFRFLKIKIDMQDRSKESEMTNNGITPYLANRWKIGLIIALAVS